MTMRARAMPWPRHSSPPKPAWNNVEVRTKYLQPCHAHNKITSEQIWKQLRRLKPYKALGPDGISDIVLTKCTNILLDGLFYIYTAILEGNLQYKPWKTFTTVVLCKPRKARYDILKSYRPIVLVNTMWKVLTVVIAEQITYLTEKFQLLPKNHFEGRPGQTTTDAMHVLTNGIKTAWRKGKIVAVLFLDIEGAFPNAVLEMLMHNLRKRGVPVKYIEFIRNMLKNWETTLRFDDYSSDLLTIDNGIGQEDPLSMVMYQFYNADLLDILKDTDESAMAYVDNTLMLTIADTFKDAHLKLTNIMSKRGGIDLTHKKEV
jgi:hypothetical protein